MSDPKSPSLPPDWGLIGGRSCESCASLRARLQTLEQENTALKESARVVAELNQPKLEQEMVTAIRIQTLEQALEIAVNTCGDVTKFGRFSRSVDPVKWVEQLEAHLKAALAASRGREPERT